MTPPSSSTPRLVVAGSLNVDHFAMVERLPAPGETLTAHACFTRFGGKGANQALAAARLGASVAMLGMLGEDPDAQRYRDHLAAEGLDLAGLGTAPGSSGSAMITVEDGGENVIIVNPGANAGFRPEHVIERRAMIENAMALLLQLEVPLDTVVAAARLAQEAGVPVILNPSPFRDDFPWGEVPLHSVIVNESEAARLLGAPLTAVADPGGLLAERGIGTLIVTRGSGSTLAFGSGEPAEAPACPVEPVDTVGAGDAFAGAFAVATAEGMALVDALAFANAAGALATLKPGAQEAIPTRADLESFLS